MAPKKLNPEDFGDNAPPSEPVRDPNNKQFAVTLKDGTQLMVMAFRLFTSYDANLGLVVRALREDESEVGVFYAPLGWKLNNASDWVTP